jgi:peptidoglycan/LPS O-acetylase OafA/YrhL
LPLAYGSWTLVEKPALALRKALAARNPTPALLALLPRGVKPATRGVQAADLPARRIRLP